MEDSSPENSEAALQASLPDALQLAGDERVRLLEILIRLAQAQITQKKINEARENLSQAEKLLAELHAACPVPLKITWLIEKGRFYILDKTPSQARSVFVEAWTLAANAKDDFLSIEIAKLMAVIEPQKTQQEWIRNAIEIAEKSSEKKALHCLGGLYAALGWKLYDLRQYEKSLEIFGKSLTHLRQQGSVREVFIAKWSTGKVLRAMNRFEEALKIQKELLLELEMKGGHDGRLYEELAECLQALKRPDEAQTYFELAYKELSREEWVNDNQPVKLQRMKDLGKVKEKR